jgi:predicted Zn-ribbon and HTH transcriptional regulator
LRKKIAEALEGESLDLREISKLFGIEEKEVLDHLNHIEKSVHHRGFIVEPASCQQCGFSFKKRTRLSTPGRCPVCKSGGVLGPGLAITHSINCGLIRDGCFARIAEFKTYKKEGFLRRDLPRTKKSISSFENLTLRPFSSTLASGSPPRKILELF